MSIAQPTTGTGGRDALKAQFDRHFEPEIRGHDSDPVLSDTFDCRTFGRGN